MNLYHFCADRHIKSILRTGIATGGLTEITPCGYVVHSGWVWLTIDPDPRRQSWATRNVIRYSRTAWRLTIEIPNDELCQLYNRKRIREIYPSADLLFSGWSGSDNWRIFRGSIPREYIKACDRMS